MLFNDEKQKKSQTHCLSRTYYIERILNGFEINPRWYCFLVFAYYHYYYYNCYYDSILVYYIQRKRNSTRLFYIFILISLIFYRWFCCKFFKDIIYLSLYFLVLFEMDKKKVNIFRLRILWDVQQFFFTAFTMLWVDKQQSREKRMKKLPGYHKKGSQQFYNEQE